MIWKVSFQLLYCTACGIISNLFRLLPPYQLRQWGIERIKLAGNASKNYFIDEIIRQCQGLLEVSSSTDTYSKCSAAYGAALHALHFTHTKWMQPYVSFFLQITFKLQLEEEKDGCTSPQCYLLFMKYCRYVTMSVNMK